jgi:hypothetical protein
LSRQDVVYVPEKRKISGKYYLIFFFFDGKFKKIIKKWISGAVWQNKDQTIAGRDRFMLSFFFSLCDIFEKKWQIMEFLFDLHWELCYTMENHKIKENENDEKMHVRRCPAPRRFRPCLRRRCRCERTVQTLFQNICAR